MTSAEINVRKMRQLGHMDIACPKGQKGIEAHIYCIALQTNNRTPDKAFNKTRTKAVPLCGCTNALRHARLVSALLNPGFVSVQ